MLPQMFPMYWLFLYIIFVMIYLIMNSSIYFMKIEKSNISSLSPLMKGVSSIGNNLSMKMIFD